MVEEITKKRKMTEEVKQGLNQRIFYNCLVAITVMAYICAIDAVYLYAKKEMIPVALKVFAMFLIALTISILEVSYRKESGKLAIIGIELLVFSILVLYIPQIYGNLDKLFCQVLLFTPIFCGVYYIAKSILIYIKTEKEYQNNLSDVKEIVKDEI